MIYKRFYFIIFFRTILLLLTCIWLSEAIRSPQNVYTLVVVSALLVFQVYSLVFYMNAINRDLARFFSGFQEIGTSVNPQIAVKEKSFRELSIAMNKVTDIIRKSRIETEKQLKHFEFVVENIPTGMLIINQHRQITHVNKAAKAIFKNSNIKNIDSLNRIYPELGDQLENMTAGDQKTLKLKINNELVYLLLRVSSFRSENEEVKIISFQNVINELQENELLSWQKLTRILTHEIMNSITPISSLTLATKKCLSVENKAKTKENINSESISDAILNLSLVEERSIGLKSFITKFKRVTQVPKPILEVSDINELIKRIVLLFREEFDRKGIRLILNMEKDFESVELDKKLIDQVLINLVKNSVESLLDTKDKIITISTYYRDDERPVIEVADNGKGIPDDIMENIFMPFFTTKSDGMGIGLSLARQIMRLHKGTISAISVPGKKTKFLLVF